MPRFEQPAAEFDADGYPHGPVEFKAAATYPQPSYPEHLDPANHTGTDLPADVYPASYRVADTVVDSYLNGQVN